MLRTRAGVTLLLVLVFAVNLAETVMEGRTGPGSSLSPRAYEFAHAMQTLERYLSIERFDNHDATNRLAVYGYSLSYFFVLPALLLGVGLALALRENIEGYRVLSLAIAINYVVSLLFFLWVPVPERWFVPDSGAILLSDLWRPELIEWIRPVSGLDNCFPSNHTSLTVILILVCYAFQVRLRTTVLALGMTVILSTFTLGIHWVPDILGGVLVAWMSVIAAELMQSGRQLEVAAERT